MKILDSLIDIADYQREHAEQRRAQLIARIERLRQSKQTVNEDLERLQEKYQLVAQSQQAVLAPIQLLALRQLWIETYERQQLLESLDEQLASMEKQRLELNKEVKAAWAKQQSLERAQELAIQRDQAEALRISYLIADDVFTQGRPSFIGAHI